MVADEDAMANSVAELDWFLLARPVSGASRCSSRFRWHRVGSFDELGGGSVAEIVGQRAACAVGWERSPPGPAVEGA